MLQDDITTRRNSVRDCHFCMTYYVLLHLGSLTCTECYGKGTTTKVSVDCSEGDCTLKSATIRNCSSKIPATIICGKTNNSNKFTTVNVTMNNNGRYNSKGRWKGTNNR